MRVAMGLKPLQSEGKTEAREAKERAAGKERTEAAEKKIKAEELRQRIERCDPDLILFRYTPVRARDLSEVCMPQQ